MLAKYIPEPFELHTAIYTIDDCTFAVIRVEPRPDGFCVFRVDGVHHQYDTPTFVFRQGDVFVRHGTSNERWRQSDIDRMIDRLISDKKESWWAERDEHERRRSGIAQGAQDVVSGPLSSFSWRVDLETFDAATLELFRANDDIPLRRLLNEANADVANILAGGGDRDDLVIIIGKVTSIAAQAISYRRPEWFREALAGLARIYRLGYDQNGYNRNDGVSEDLWLLVIEHVLGLGALAVRQRDWTAVRELGTTHPGGAGEHYPSWMRHSLTMASRRHRIDDGKSLITLATDRVAGLPALRPDIPADDRQVITSICQFDILAVLTIIGATNSMSGSNWYPNFARFYSSRSEPAVQHLITDSDMRETLFPLPDQDLADVLREVDRRSSIEGIPYSGWTGFDTPTVTRFLDEHPPLS